MIGVKHSNRVMQSCPIFNTITNEQALFRDSRFCPIGETKKLLDEYHIKMKPYNETKHSRPREAKVAKYEAQGTSFV